MVRRLDPSPKFRVAPFEMEIPSSLDEARKESVYPFQISVVVPFERDKRPTYSMSAVRSITEKSVSLAPLMASTASFKSSFVPTAYTYGSLSVPVPLFGLIGSAAIAVSGSKLIAITTVKISDAHRKAPFRKCFFISVLRLSVCSLKPSSFVLLW